MKWFERHLNWTIVLCALAATLAVLAANVVVGDLPIGLALWVSVTPVVQMLFALSDEGSPALGALAIVFWMFPFACCAWVLRRKSRSLWWLLVAWVPYANWFVPIALERRDQPRPPMAGCQMAADSVGLPIEMDGESRRKRANWRNRLASLSVIVSAAFMLLGLASMAFFAFGIWFMTVYPEDTVATGLAIILGVALYGPALVLGGGIVSGGVSLMVLDSGVPCSSRRRKLGYATMITSAAMMEAYSVGWVASSLLWAG